jgi:RHS repeat-associated protein
MLNDHLGNIRASISDRRQFSSPIFDPVITDATDYFPFGAPNPMVSSSAGYRYGFNGKELDKNNEFGTSNVYDYGFRIYNPSIGRFLSVDPLTRSYPELTPYQFASNTPIKAIDLDGLESWTVVRNFLPNNSKPVLKWHFDKDKPNPGGLYVISRYWNTRGGKISESSGTANYGEYPLEFPNFSKGVYDQTIRADDKPLFSVEGHAKLTVGTVGATAGVLSKKVGFVYKAGDTDLIGLTASSFTTKEVPLFGYTSIATDQSMDIGAEVGVGAATLGYKHEFDRKTHTFTDQNEILVGVGPKEVVINTYTNEMSSRLVSGVKVGLILGIDAEIAGSFNPNLNRIQFSEYEIKELNARWGGALYRISNEWIGWPTKPSDQK